MKSILIKYWYLVLIFLLFSYHSWLMQMFPWEKQTLKCKLDVENIQKYNVPKNINLEIYGWGRGKFTNSQYFGTQSFNLNTRGYKYSKILHKIFGSKQYDFDIPVKKGSWGSEWGYTHWFSIPKKKVTLKDNGKKITLESRMLLLLDMGYDGNEYPEAFWDCYDE